MQIKSLMLGGALAAVALGANNSSLTTATPDVKSACSFDDFTATGSADVSSIAACPTAVGDITIEGDAFGSIELNGVEQVYGNLHVNNVTKATSLTAATLELVSGDLALSGNTILATLNLAQLQTVGSFKLNALPALEELGLTSGITSAEEVIIADTGLSAISGINVVELKNFDVNNNGNIESIDSGLQKVTGVLSISYNAEGVEVAMDKLKEVKTMYLQSITSLSVPSLTKATGSISFVSNEMDSIDISSLSEIGNALTIMENSELEEIEFKNLTEIGGALVIEDNDKLTSFSGFPELTKIGGSVNISGSFDNGTFDSLDRVSGGFSLRSSGDLTCEEFNELNKDGDVRGDKYYCSGADAETSSSSAKSHLSTSSSSASGSSDDDDESSGSGDSTSSSEDKGSSLSGGIMAVLVGAAAVGLTLY